MSDVIAIVKNIHKGVVLTNVDSGDIIGESSPVGDGVSVQAESLLPLYKTVAYEVHNIRADLTSLRIFSVRLDVPSGCGRKRTDKIAIVDDVITIVDTWDKGLYQDKLNLINQQRNEKRRGSKFIFNNKHYIGILGSLGSDDTLEVGGLDVITMRELLCNREQFGNESPIESQEIITIGGKKHRIDNVVIRPATVSFHIVEV